MHIASVLGHCTLQAKKLANSFADVSPGFAFIISQPTRSAVMSRVPLQRDSESLIPRNLFFAQSGLCFSPARQSNFLLRLSFNVDSFLGRFAIRISLLSFSIVILLELSSIERAAKTPITWPIGRQRSHRRPLWSASTNFLPRVRFKILIACSVLTSPFCSTFLRPHLHLEGPKTFFPRPKKVFSMSSNKKSSYKKSLSTRTILL